MTRPSRSRPQQRGAALLTAMVIVTLIATLSAAMVWQQWRAVQVEAAERAQAQARWILQGALDWARLILREDGRSNSNAGTDNLTEPWAVPLSEARLSTFLSGDGQVDDDAPEAFLSGAIADAQARYNLRNLLQGSTVRPEELRVLQRLCSQAGLDPTWATRIAQSLAKAGPAGSPPPPGGQPTGPATPPEEQLLMPPSERQLTWFGLTPERLAPLLPYIVLLPVQTPVNVNTAPKEVLAAVIDGIDLGMAERIVQARQRQPFQNLAAVQDLLGTQVRVPQDRLGVSTAYFEVTGTLRLDQLTVAQRSLVRRERVTVTVLRTERLREAPVPLQQ